MTKEEKLLSAVKRIAWGYVFLHLNINLGSLNILPDWAGYALIVSALPVLAEEGRPSQLLRPLAVGLGVWDAVVWGLGLLGLTLDELGAVSSAGAAIVSFANLLVGVVSLYFHFQLLTDLAAVAEAYDCPEAKRLLTLRSVRTVLAAAMVLPIPWENVQWLSALFVGANLVVLVWLCGLLFSLCRSLREKCGENLEENQEEPPAES